MASVSISCPSCSATDGVVRNGKSTAGHQRYLCSHCRKTWQLQFTYTASQPGTHQKIIDTHIMRLLISLWDVGTVFFTIYPQVFRHEKSSIYYKYIEPLSYCFSISFKILIITVYGFMKWYICKCLFCKVYLLDLSYNRNAKPMTGSNELRFNLTQIRG